MVPNYKSAVLGYENHQNAPVKTPAIFDLQIALFSNQQYIAI
jgi:hypothetical protein